MTSIENPDHPVPPDVAKALLAFDRAQLGMLDRQNQIVALARPSRNGRESEAEADRVSAHVARTPATGIADFNETQRFITGVREFPPVLGPQAPPVDVIVPPPAATDHSFWWARTETKVGASFRASFDTDGVRFGGGATRHDGDLFFTSFGATATFELQANRVPTSPSGRWISTPHVELFGNLLGRTGDSDLLTGDLWSKCWVHLSQRIFQVGFGQDGPAEIPVAQADEHNTLIFEENTGRAVHAGMPGVKLLPSVIIGNFNRVSSLWARLEVRFDIQLEGAGTLLWADPEVLLRTFQWPLNPLV